MKRWGYYLHKHMVLNVATWWILPREDNALKRWSHCLHKHIVLDVTVWWILHGAENALKRWNHYRHKHMVFYMATWWILLGANNVLKRWTTTFISTQCLMWLLVEFQGVDNALKRWLHYLQKFKVLDVLSFWILNIHYYEVLNVVA